MPAWKNGDDFKIVHAICTIYNYVICSLQLRALEIGKMNEILQMKFRAQGLDNKVRIIVY